jgi:dolichol-phosphate mannosyltransferase
MQLKDNSCDLSVVIPSLNEAENLKKLLPALFESLASLGVTHEVLVVDGDSPDDTQKVVTGAGARYCCEKERGYGRAILRGVAEAQGAYVLTMDADLSHPSAFVKDLWAARQEADIVIASRYVDGGKADQPWARLMLSKVLNAFFGWGLSMAVKDMSSGYRLYNKNVFRKLDLSFTNFVFLIELLLMAFKEGRQIREVAFHYQPRGEGRSHAQVIKFGMDYLRLFHRMWRIRNSIDFPDYDWRAHDSRIPLQRYWQRKRHRIIMRFTPENVSTLDAGCGSSKILASLPHAIGMDMRFDKLSFMRAHNDFLLQGDGCLLPFKDEEFECAISSQVIEHIPDEGGRLLDELTRVLKPNGILVLGTPDYGNWQWRVTERLYDLAAPGAYADEHVTQYTFKSLKEALEERGFEILDHDYILQGELVFKARKIPLSTAGV